MTGIDVHGDVTELSTRICTKCGIKHYSVQ